MGGTIALHAATRMDAVRIVCVTDGSSTQYPGDAEIRAQKEEEARAAAAELGVTDYVHLDLPDMKLDTLPHVEVNKVVEEQIARLPARDRLHGPPGREPRPQSTLRLGRRRHAPRARPAGAPRPHLCTHLEHRVDARRPQLVRSELVRRRDGDAGPQARIVRALRDGGTSLPPPAQRACDQGGGRVLRRELRLRGGRALRARARARRLNPKIPVPRHQCDAATAAQPRAFQGWIPHEASRVGARMVRRAARSSSCLRPNSTLDASTEPSSSLGRLGMPRAPVFRNVP